MKLLLSQEFKFDAAHNLINYHGKCEKLHGHTYKLRVTLEGKPDPLTGMLMDFSIFKNLVNDKIIEKLDHSYINDNIKLSTAENIAEWIWNRLEKPLKGDNYSLFEIVLWETETSFVTLRNDS